MYAVHLDILYPCYPSYANSFLSTKPTIAVATDKRPRRAVTRRDAARRVTHSSVCLALNSPADHTLSAMSLPVVTIDVSYDDEKGMQACLFFLACLIR